MVKVQEIGVKINENNVNHKFFDFLNSDDKTDVVNTLKSGYGHFVLFYVDGKERFGAFIELYKDNVHVMIVGGKFPAYINELKKYCIALGKKAGKKTITFGTERNGVSIIGEKLGFTKNSSGEYTYVI